MRVQYLYFKRWSSGHTGRWYTSKLQQNNTSVSKEKTQLESFKSINLYYSEMINGRHESSLGIRVCLTRAGLNGAQLTNYIFFRLCNRPWIKGTRQLNHASIIGRTASRTKDLL